MKILVINILRLGDVIMSVPTLHGLKEKYPGAQVDLLVNDQCRKLEPLLESVDNFYYFERKQYQQMMRSKEQPLLSAVYELRNLVDSINSQSYDLVINLTHNKQSAWLMGAIESQEKRGLTLAVNQGIHLGSSWFRYLNEVDPENVEEFFHYVDIYRYGAGCEVGSKVNFTLPRTRKGEFEKKNHLRADSKYIAFQLLTSTPDKEMGLEKNLMLLKSMSLAFPNHKLMILGAPFEKEQIDNLLNESQKIGVEPEKVLCSIEGAVSILDGTDLLISCDTSIKHLANATKCKVIEISLGPSDIRRTGIYKKDQVMVVGDSSIEHLVDAAKHLLDDSGLDSSLSNIYVSKMGPGYWFNQSISHDAQSTLWRYIKRSQEKLDLDVSHLSQVGNYGTEAQQIVDLVGSESISGEFVEILEERIGVLKTDQTKLEKSSDEFIDWVSSGLQSDSNFPKIEFKLSGMNFLEKRGRSNLPLHQLRKVEEDLKKKTRALLTERKLLESVRFITSENTL